jgi:hypothetical protein
MKRILYQLAFRGGILNLRRDSGLSLSCWSGRMLPGQGQAAVPTDSFFVRRVVLFAENEAEAYDEIAVISIEESKS